MDVFTVVAAALNLLAVPLAAWVAGALYFDLGGGGRRGQALAAAWMVAAGVAWWQWPRRLWPLACLWAACGGIVVWWLRLRPSHDRRWHPNYALLPIARLQGDELAIDNVRNVDFRAPDDYVTRFENRVYRLSDLRGADLALCYWGSWWMCHPLMIFDFGPAGALCFSIEVRYRRGQSYRFLASLYRQQELMYVICDPRDALLRRTRDPASEACYLYRLQLRPETVREMLLEYVHEAQRIAAEPRWYHGLAANCTTSVYWQRQGKIHWDWRFLVNGWLDRALYERAILDPRLPFAELKARSRIDEIANAAPRADFYRSLHEALDRQAGAPTGSAGR